MKRANNKIEATGNSPCDFLQRLVATAPHLLRYKINVNTVVNIIKL